MGKTPVDPKIVFQESFNIINKDLPEIYLEYYPIAHLVRETAAVEFKVIQQLGSIIYESRDCTHFIMRTSKIYDMLTPHEYEYHVTVYDPDTKSAWGPKFYGREIECRAWILKWQENHYGFNYHQYLTLSGKLRKLEERLAINSEYLTDKQNNELKELLASVLRALRIQLKLPQDGDVPDLTLEEAIHENAQ